jgi:chorismate mutase
MTMTHPALCAAPPPDKSKSASSSGSTTAPDDAQRRLEDMRSELDAIDARLLEDLRQRLEICTRIGLHKKAHAIPMLHPARIGFVHLRAAAFAAVHGLRPGFVRAVYNLVIAESCRLEDEIIRARRSA